MRSIAAVCVAASGIALAGGCGGSAPPPTSSSDSSPKAGASAREIDLTGLDTSVLRGRRIVIDPGHGGRFAGVTGRDSTREADVNLGVSLHLWGLLRDAGADVHLTRHSDRDLLPSPDGAVRDDLAARVAILDSLAPDVFLSLHHNSNAALDRERNAIETYYKLDDDGPSYDLGRSIHGELVRALGIEEARLRPGNYFVLRGASMAAVLGEASYLSNPVNEAQLKLAAQQRLEAAAYFRGLVDYFQHGVAALTKRLPAGDTLQADAELAFATTEALDPATIEVRAGMTPFAIRLDDDGRGFTARAALAPGLQVIEARARLARGNAARPFIDTLFVHVPAAHAFATAEPTTRSGRTRIRGRAVDAAGRGVGDGVPVQWRLTNATLVDADSVHAGGEARAVVQARGAGARVELVCGGATAPLALPAARLNALELVRCVDARNQKPLAGAWERAGAETSDRRGWLAVAGDSTLAIECPGYEPWSGRSPADGRVGLVPVYGGVLHGLQVVLDPAGDGGDTALPGTTFAAADADHDICSRLQTQLQAAGARAPLTRTRSGAATEIERVRAAAGARWFVRVEATTDGGAPAVWHYPGSEDGARLAQAIARTWSARRAKPVAVRAESRFILQQTPCPAVWVRVPAAACSTLAGRREVAHAIGAGLRAAEDAQMASWPALRGQVQGGGADLVRLDGVDVVPVGSDGSFRFESVAPGTRWLEAIGDRPRRLRVAFSAEAASPIVIR